MNTSVVLGKKVGHIIKSKVISMKLNTAVLRVESNYGIPVLVIEHNYNRR